MNAVVSAQMKDKPKSWFIIGADYAFGKLYEETATKVINDRGGSVLGAVRAPLGSTDFSSYILKAKSSKADIIFVSLGGVDLVNAMKQIDEFKITSGGQKIAMGVALDQDIHAVGLDVLQGLQSAVPFYWDLDDKSRALTARLQKKRDTVPNGLQAGVYSVVLTYLKAIQAIGTK